LPATAWPLAYPRFTTDNTECRFAGLLEPSDGLEPSTPSLPWSAFLLKDARELQLVAAVRVVADGGSLFSPSVTRRLIEQFARAAPPSSAELAELTAREQEVLRLVARGRSNAEIASELVVSEHTAKTHVASILQKLELRNRTQIVILAYECGLVRPGDRA
jgi:DNA-binding NarL/FixJ family response regulator